MNAELKTTFIKLKDPLNRIKNVQFFMSKDSPNCIFQYRFFKIQGYKIEDNQILNFLLSGKDFQDLSLASLKIMAKQRKMVSVNKKIHEELDYFSGNLELGDQVDFIDV